MDYGTMAVKATEDRAALNMHDLRDPEAVHDNLQPSSCKCRAPRNGHEPVSAEALVRGDMHEALFKAEQPKKFNTDTGDACHNCGGTTVRTGSCHTCTTCGTTSGCG